MSKIKIVAILLLISVVKLNTVLAQQDLETANSPIKWMTVDQAWKQYKLQPKPMLIDVYTDWCGWCKQMMKTTFASKDLANYINTNFYPVRFDAETKDTLHFFDTTFINRGAVGQKSTHNLAIKLLNGQLSYPTLVYIDREKNFFPVPGYMKVNEIEPFLVFFANDVNKSSSFEEFRNTYLYAFPGIYKEDIEKLPATQKLDTTGVVKWFSIEEAIKKSQASPRPIYIDLYADFEILCKVYKNTNYKIKAIAQTLNDKYYPVRFNVLSKDTVKILGAVYPPGGSNQPHQLAASMLASNFKFPSIVILNEKFEMVNKNQEFFAPNFLRIVLQYFGTAAYKSSSFDAYLKANPAN